jgi:hypothetical protein
MKIIIKNNCRILVKDNGNEVNINDGDVVEYNGIYYKYIENEIANVFGIETAFVGIVESERSNQDGFQGIYIKPLYILSIIKREWMKINDYEHPKEKYFLYPHLLILPEKYYHSKPLYFLHTCKNSSLSDFNNITKEFSLGNTPYY